MARQARKTRTSSPAVIVGLLVFGGFITIFNEAEMNIALAIVSEIYGVPVATTQWLTTRYMLVAGALMPLATFVMGRLGSRSTVLVSLSALLVDVLDRRYSNVDIVSVVLSCMGFGGVVFGIGQAASYGFVHPLVIGPLVIGAAALAVYARRQLASEHPLLNLHILTYPRYRRSLALMCVLQLVLFGGVLVAPLFLLRGWGLSAMEAALYMLPGGILTAVGNLLAGMAYDRFGTKTVPFGLVGNAIGYIGVTVAIGIGSGLFGGAVVDGSTARIMLVVFCALYSGALPFAMTALTTNSLGCLGTSELPDASSMNNTLSQIFGSIGTALYTLIVYQLFSTADSTATATATPLAMGSTVTLGLSAALVLVALGAFIAPHSSLSEKPDSASGHPSKLQAAPAAKQGDAA